MPKPSREEALNWVTTTRSKLMQQRQAGQPDTGAEQEFDRTIKWLAAEGILGSGGAGFEGSRPQTQPVPQPQVQTQPIQAAPAQQPTQTQPTGGGGKPSRQEALDWVYTTQYQLEQKRQAGEPDTGAEQELGRTTRWLVDQGIVEPGALMSAAEEAVPEAVHPFHPGIISPRSGMQLLNSVMAQTNAPSSGAGIAGATLGEALAEGAASRLPGGNLALRVARHAISPIARGAGAAGGYAAERKLRGEEVKPENVVGEGIGTAAFALPGAAFGLAKEAMAGVGRHTAPGRLLRENAGANELIQGAQKIFDPPTPDVVSDAYRKVYSSGIMMPSRGGNNPVTQYLNELTPNQLRNVRRKMLGAKRPRNLKGTISNRDINSFHEDMFDNFLGEQPGPVNIGALDAWRQAVREAASSSDDALADVMQGLLDSINRHEDSVLGGEDAIRWFAGEIDEMPIYHGEYIPPGPKRGPRGDTVEGEFRVMPEELPSGRPAQETGFSARRSPGHYYDPRADRALPTGERAVVPRGQRDWQRGQARRDFYYYDPDVARQLPPGQPPSNISTERQQGWRPGGGPQEEMRMPWWRRLTGGEPPKRSAPTGSPQRPRMSRDEAVQLLHDARQQHFRRVSTEELTDMLRRTGTVRPRENVKGNLWEMRVGKLAEMFGSPEQGIPGVTRTKQQQDVLSRLDRGVEGGRQALYDMAKRLEAQHMPMFRTNVPESRGLIDTMHRMIATIFLSDWGRKMFERAIVEGRGYVPSGTISRIANEVRRTTVGPPISEGRKDRMGRPVSSVIGNPQAAGAYLPNR